MEEGRRRRASGEPSRATGGVDRGRKLRGDFRFLLCPFFLFFKKRRIFTHASLFFSSRMSPLHTPGSATLRHWCSGRFCVTSCVHNSSSGSFFSNFSKGVARPEGEEVESQILLFLPPLFFFFICCCCCCCCGPRRWIPLLPLFTLFFERYSPDVRVLRVLGRPRRLLHASLGEFRGGVPGISF